MIETISCVADIKAVLGEGPVWVEREQALFWVDIMEQRAFRWSQRDGLRTFSLPSYLCSMAPRAAGGFIGAGYDGFLAFDFDELRFEPLGNPEPSLKSNRFNDGKTDRQGRFWAGTMDRHEREASGSLYRLDPDLGWTRIDTGYRVTNGPAFSLDGKIMYHSDSALQRVYAFDIDPAGAASGRRLFAQFGSGEGYPDGMTVDSEDCLWIAFWDGWCVRRLSPAGDILAKIPLPVQQPTSCAFGGADLTSLFVTSARRGLDAQLANQPQAGGLFELVGQGGGVAETPFSG